MVEWITGGGATNFAGGGHSRTTQLLVHAAFGVHTTIACKVLTLFVIAAAAADAPLLVLDNLKSLYQAHSIIQQNPCTPPPLWLP